MFPFSMDALQFNLHFSSCIFFKRCHHRINTASQPTPSNSYHEPQTASRVRKAGRVAVAMWSSTATLLERMAGHPISRKWCFERFQESLNPNHTLNHRMRSGRTETNRRLPKPANPTEICFRKR